MPMSAFPARFLHLTSETETRLSVGLYQCQCPRPSAAHFFDTVTGDLRSQQCLTLYLKS